jgi:galactokinase
MHKASSLQARFRAMFGSAARIYRAPGRVNLIGEHTDYNNGFVLPAAIEFSCWVGIAPRDDRKLILYSENFEQTYDADLDALKSQSIHNWVDYPLGVAWALEQAGYRLRGANLYISGEVPLGSGLSSSAAIEVSTGYALMEASHLPVDRKQLALACQRAENAFVGVRCGIMDQFASCYGRAGCALMLDCRALEVELVRLPPNVQLIICNTMVKHDNATGEYNARRAECEEAVHLFAQVLPAIGSLRDITFAQLEQHRGRLPERIYKRCRHVITENDRVRLTARAFQIGDRAELARLMADSHRSLRHDYQVSCPELDLMVEIASRQHGVCGARMTGGGFGGCTVNLVAAADSLEFQRNVASEYQRRTGLRPDIFICEAAEGAESVKVMPAAGESIH